MAGRSDQSIARQLGIAAGGLRGRPAPMQWRGYRHEKLAALVILPPL
jgi:hypothetical protein